MSLPDEIIYVIISYLPKHPIMTVRHNHIQNYRKQYGPSPIWYFKSLKAIKVMYANQMDYALLKYKRKVKQMEFMKKCMHNEGASCRHATNQCKLENGYDSDNNTIGDDYQYTDSD